MNTARNVVGVALWVLAGLLALYAIWAFTNCYGYISEMVNAGQISRTESRYEIISFYMSNAAQYFVYAILLAAVGVMAFPKEQKVLTEVDSSQTRPTEADEAETILTEADAAETILTDTDPAETEGDRAERDWSEWSQKIQSAEERQERDLNKG